MRVGEEEHDGPENDVQEVEGDEEGEVLQEIVIAEVRQGADDFHAEASHPVIEGHPPEIPFHLGFVPFHEE